MASLGSFGVAHDQATPKIEPDTFTYFGVQIRIVDEVDDLDLIDFLEAARGVEDAGLMALAAVKDGLRILIHPDDFTLFWKTARANKQQVEDLSTLFSDLLTSETDRPTQQLSDSSSGQLPTVENSLDDSSSPAEPVGGRPDLQIIHDDSRASLARIAQIAATG